MPPFQVALGGLVLSGLLSGLGPGLRGLELHVKPADQLVTNLSWPDPIVEDADLRFDVAAHETVYLFAMLRVYGASAAPGLRIAVAGPLGSDVFYGPIGGINVSAAGQITKRNEHTTGTIIDFATGHTGGGPGTRAAHLWGVLRNGSTPGMGVIQWYQNMAHPDAAGLLQDSVLLVIRVP